MSLEEALHQRWAADPKLQEWLPVEQMFTGRVSHGQMPYGTLWRVGSRPLWRTAAGDLLEEVQLALHIWHPEYDRLRAVVDQLRRLLDRSSFELQEPEGHWLANVEMTAQVYWPPED